MSGVRHHDAPVMPSGPTVFAPDLRHFVVDLDLWLQTNLFFLAISHTDTAIFIFLTAANNGEKRLIFV